MKKTALVIALVALFALAITSSAFATYGDSSYTAWSSVKADNSAVNGSQSPHGGYAQNTKKCVVCHAVHNAGPSGNGVGSEALLLSSRADACTYCHISNAVSTKIVYGGTATNYNGGSNVRAHDASGWANLFGCKDCHQVHGATADMTGNTYLNSKILKKGADYDWGIVTAANPTTAAAIANEASSSVAVSKWCTRCHPYFNDQQNRDSHVMTTTIDNGVTYSITNACESCHNSTKVSGVVVASAFPHYTDGARFLTSATSTTGAGSADSTDTKMDGICLRCHRDGQVSALGVGVTE
ncbi:MAG: hypothetical protein WC971_09040 [Coriobacteriia bacterium]